MNSNQKTKIAIIGGGPAGVMSAIIASENKKNEIFILDKGIILNTIIPTGGGRCNLAYAEYDFKELTKFYPRGEKFLYSIFSKFSTKETIDFFKNIGVETYKQEDNRIFPTTNSSKEVKSALLKELNKKNITKVFEQVLDLKKEQDFFILKTNKSNYKFDKIVIASGGKGNGQTLAQKLGHNIIPLKPSLCSLITKEKIFSSLSGISLKNIKADVFFENKKIKTINGDFLFTHKGISGPVIYKISSYCAYLNFSENNPLKIVVNFSNENKDDFNKKFLDMLKKYPQKESANILSLFIPKNLAYLIFDKENIDKKIKAGQLTKIDREKIVNAVTNNIFHAINRLNGEEIVTAGGIDLKEINPKTMESKLIKNLYFCGEVIDVDGLTGGFNLQNCWSSGFIVGNSLSNNEN